MSPSPLRADYIHHDNLYIKPGLIFSLQNTSATCILVKIQILLHFVVRLTIANKAFHSFTADQQSFPRIGDLLTIKDVLCIIF